MLAMTALRNLPEGVADGVHFPGWCEALAASDA